MTNRSRKLVDALVNDRPPSSPAAEIIDRAISLYVEPGPHYSGEPNQVDADQQKLTAMFPQFSQQIDVFFSDVGNISNMHDELEHHAWDANEIEVAAAERKVEQDGAKLLSLLTSAQ
jgi:hypothetical protein